MSVGGGKVSFVAPPAIPKSTGCVQSAGTSSVGNGGAAFMLSAAEGAAVIAKLGTDNIGNFQRYQRRRRR